MTADVTRAMQRVYAAIEAAENEVIEAYGEAAPVGAFVAVERAVTEVYTEIAR